MLSPACPRMWAAVPLLVSEVWAGGRWRSCVHSRHKGPVWVPSRPGFVAKPWSCDPGPHLGLWGRSKFLLNPRQSLVPRTCVSGHVTWGGLKSQETGIKQTHCYWNPTKGNKPKSKEITNPEMCDLLRSQWQQLCCASSASPGLWRWSVPRPPRNLADLASGPSEAARSQVPWGCSEFSSSVPTPHPTMCWELSSNPAPAQVWVASSPTARVTHTKSL